MTRLLFFVICMLMYIFYPDSTYLLFIFLFSEKHASHLTGYLYMLYSAIYLKQIVTLQINYITKHTKTFLFCSAPNEYSYKSRAFL